MLKLPAEAHKMVFIRYLLILGATLYSSLSLAQKEISAERKENNESTKNAENIENIENIENKDTISVESKDHVREDPGLLKWLSKYADIASLDSAANKEELIVKEDPLTQTYLHLRFFNLTRDRNRARALALSAIPELVQYSDHPLLPYALREMLESLRKIEDKPSIEIVQNFLENHVWSSCPTSQFFKSSLTQKDFLINDSQKVPKYLEKLSLTQKNLQNTLDYILKIIPREKRPFFKKNLYPFVKDYPALAKKFTWLNDQSSPGTLSESFKYLIKLGKSFTLNDCENHFLKFKKDLASMREITFEAMTERSELIETCFKAKGAKHAIKFWKDFLPQLELAFGLQGKLYSYYRTSYLLWNMDHHDQAKQVLQEILALYGKHENFVVFDKSFYLLARIVENEEKFDEAIAHYKYFI